MEFPITVKNTLKRVLSVLSRCPLKVNEREYEGYWNVDSIVRILLKEHYLMAYQNFRGFTLVNEKTTIKVGVEGDYFLGTFNFLHPSHAEVKRLKKERFPLGTFKEGKNGMVSTLVLDDVGYLYASCALAAGFVQYIPGIEYDEMEMHGILEPDLTVSSLVNVILYDKGIDLGLILPPMNVKKVNNKKYRYYVKHSEIQVR